MTQFRLVFIMIVLALVAVPAVLAEEVFGNLPDNGAYGGWCSAVALGFTVPQGQDFRLDSVELGLRHLVNDDISLEIYSDSNGEPGVALASLGTRSVTQNFEYTFNSNAGMTLSAGQTYWLYVDASECTVTWDDIGESQPSGNFAVVDYLRFNDGWVDASDSGRLMPALTMNATGLGGN